MILQNITSSIVASCWIIFFIYWLVSAFFVKKTVERYKGNLPALLGRLIIAFAVIVLVSLKDYSIIHFLISPTGPLSEASLITGAAITVIGLAIAIWARFTIGKNWSGQVTFKKDHELITRGPYKFVRHPIYTGLLTMMLGALLYFGSLLVLLLFISSAIGFAFKFKQEEKVMIKHFGKRYQDYMKRKIDFILSIIIAQTLLTVNIGYQKSDFGS